MSKNGTTIQKAVNGFQLSDHEIDMAIEYFGSLTAFDALECLSLVLNAGSAQIQLNGTYTCTVRELLDAPQIYHGEMAHEVKLSFYGGPPNSCELFDGNLLMMLVDHFLFSFVAKHDDKVQKALTYV